MDTWEALVHQYPKDVDQRTFTRTLQTVEIVLTEDLALFEIEWFVHSLLNEPVELLKTMSMKRKDEAWWKPIRDAFKLLSKIVCKFEDVMESHYKNIVQVCQQSLDTDTRNVALACLTHVVQRSAESARVLHQYVDELSRAKTNKSQLALLVGTVCSHQPDVVRDQANRIFSIFLGDNMLNNKKNSSTVMCSILQGLAGLFKNFGDELLTARMPALYNTLKHCSTMAKCDQEALKFLQQYGVLFPEQLLKDSTLRETLWRSTKNPREHLLSDTLYGIYRAIFSMARQKKNDVQKILDDEVKPHLSGTGLTRYTALRLMTLAKKKFKITYPELEEAGDVQVLEFELRQGEVTYDIANEVAWRLEYDILNNEKLLQTAIMFFTNLPEKIRKKVVVYNLFEAPEDIRKASVIFLTTESCQDDASFDRFQPLWIMILDSQGGMDTKVLEGSLLVLEDFMDYLALVLEMFLEEEHESVPERVCVLLRLCALVLRAAESGGRAGASCARVLRCVRAALTGAGGSAGGGAAWGVRSHLVRAGSALAAHVHQHDRTSFYKMLSIDACASDDLLDETCVALVHAPDDAGCVNELLKAVQVTLSRRDAEASLLCAALRKLDTLLCKQRQDLDDTILTHTLFQVERLRTRKGTNGKHDRILNREIFMFLGKLGGNIKYAATDSDVIGSHESLALTLQNTIDGNVYKVDLREILQLALVEEDSDALRSILAVLCANNPSAAWCAGHVGCAGGGARALRACVVLATAPTHAAALPHVLRCIESEQSASVRKLLSDGVVRLLTSADGHDLITTALERALSLIEDNSYIQKRTGLVLVESLIKALDDNNDLSQRFLPRILTSVANTFDIISIAAFDAAQAALFDKIALFDESTLNGLRADLMAAIIRDGEENVTDDNESIYKLRVKKVLDVLKPLYIKEVDFVGVSVKRLYVAAQASKIDVKCLGESLIFEVLNRKVDVENWFEVETFLLYLKEFADVLLADYADQTIGLINNIITNLNPRIILRVKKSLLSCVKVISERSSHSLKITSSINNWLARETLDKITADLQKSTFNSEYEDLVSALDVYTYVGCCLDEENKECIKQWPLLLFKMWNKMEECPSHLLRVSMRCLSQSDIKKFILDAQRIVPDDSNKGITHYCRINMSVLFEYLVRKPYLLLENDMSKFSVLLNDMVQWFVLKKCPVEFVEDVLDLVDQLWPSYEAQMPFGRKVLLLQNMQRLPKNLLPESAPMRWVVDQMEKDDVAAMAHLVGLLPPEEAYSAQWGRAGAQLPTRVRELRAGPATHAAHAALFRALLDAAADGHRPPLHIVATLAAADDTEGWWVEAFDSCMASLALKADREVYDYLYKRCWQQQSLGVCQRLYLPLLKYSTSSFCEQYLPDVVREILTTFDVNREMRPAPGVAYLMRVLDCTVAFSIIEVALEKLSTATLEQTASRLNSMPGARLPWHVLRRVAALGLKFRQRLRCPEAADQTLKDACRAAQCAAFGCTSAALRRYRPAESCYQRLFEPSLWETLIDTDATFDLPLPSQRVNRMVRRSVAADDVSSGAGGAGTRRTLTRTRSVRSRLFLRTLSQNPLHFDLDPLATADPEAPDSPQWVEVCVRASALSESRAYVAASALVRHAAAAPLRLRLLEVAAALASHTHRNAKLLLAQVICDCRAELAPFSKIFRAPLFQFLAEMAEDEPLNSLHLDVFNTLSEWRDTSEPTEAEAGHMNEAVVNLLLGIVNNRHKEYTYRQLLSCLNNLLEVYGARISFQWNLFERWFYDDEESKSKCCLKILQILTKNKVYISGMVEDIIQKKSSVRRLSAEEVRLVGAALGARRHDAALHQFAALLDAEGATLHFLAALEHAQNLCDACCTPKQFKDVVKLLPKVPNAEKKKCLRIMGSFLSGPYCTPSAADVFETVNFEEYFQDSDLMEEALKCVRCGWSVCSARARRRLLELALPHCARAPAAYDLVLNAFQGLSRGSGSAVLGGVSGGDELYRRAVDALAAAGPLLAQRLANQLAHDMPTRLAESYYLAVHIPMRDDGETADVSQCGVSFVETLLGAVRTHTAFKNLKLSNEPINRSVPSDVAGDSEDASAPVVDVQMPVDDVLSSLLRFAKMNGEASVSLCAAVCAGVVRACAAPVPALLHDMLERALAAPPAPPAHTAHPPPLLHLLLRLCRVMLPHIHSLEGFKEPVGKLKSKLKGTEGENIATLLYEDILLRTSGPELFVLGSNQEAVDVTMLDEDVEFSIKDLVSSFGKLSNLDKLPLQRKRWIEHGGLPALWTDHQTFKRNLESYTANGDGWFDKMVSAYRDTAKMETVRWYRHLQRWPRAHFRMSAVGEAIQWLYESDNCLHYAEISEIPTEDCLSEWAARFMIRAAYLWQHNENSPHSLSRSHELSWCKRANEMGLHAQVLHCVARNSQYLKSNENLPWLVQKLIARRALALARNDTTNLAEVLEDAEKYPQMFAHGEPAELLHSGLLMLLLRRDINKISKANVDKVLQNIRIQCSRIEHLCSSSKKIVQETLHKSMACYHDLWASSEDEHHQAEILTSMGEVIRLSVELECDGVDIHVAVLLDRVLNWTGKQNADRQILDILQTASARLSGAGAAALERALGVGAVRAVRGDSAEEQRADHYRRCLQLLCDPPHTLAMYCELLHTALCADDPVQWNKTFSSMSQKLFENPLMGSDFRLLGKYKEPLYSIRNYGQAERNSVVSVLSKVVSECRLGGRDSLKLSQLCGALAPTHVRADPALAALLGLPPARSVLALHEQVTVVGASARRPCVVRVLLCEGASRRYLHKVGDAPLSDAAALHAAAALLPAATTYTVKPLSEDCGLIEYLDDHFTLRSLIAETADKSKLDELAEWRNDEELILQPAAAVEHSHQHMCAAVPPHALRASIEKRSASLQDFVNRKNKFLETLVANTLICWLLGVGDRHLENLLCGGAAGVVGVDWAAALQFGARELPPARLTRNLLALVHMEVLECRLQQQLSHLRENSINALAMIKFAFNWMGEGFAKKLKYIEGLLRGTYLPHHVTKMALQEQGLKHFEKYQALLDLVFQDYKTKEQYTVEEQVSCLLRQCTDPRILGVTRSGWEPWL